MSEINLGDLTSSKINKLKESKKYSKTIEVNIHLRHPF